MKKHTMLTGYLLILAALTFWLSWFLMPDPGTTDTNHILTIVKQFRTSVLYSVIIQIVSSVLYVGALILLIKVSFPKGKTLTGIALLGIGAMGLCADAFFHLLAWYMTDSSVTIQEDVVRVMEFMQTDALIFLVPLLLPLFIGSPVLAIGLHKQGMLSRIPALIFIVALLIGPIVVLLTKKVFGYNGPAFMLITLGIFSVAQAFIGYELIKISKKIKSSLTTADLLVLAKAK